MERFPCVAWKHVGQPKHPAISQCLAALSLKASLSILLHYTVHLAAFLEKFKDQEICKLEDVTHTPLKLAARHTFKVSC
jgi:hypothetical protein